jgi:hypothetical protein
MKRMLARPKVQLWLAISGAATLVLIGAYAMVQQSTRLGANDLPTVQAQTIEQSLGQGAAPEEAVADKSIDLGSGALAPFTIITDDSYHVLAASAVLNGKTPLPPAGVFKYTKAHKNDNITWQPQPGVRIAAHVTTFSTPTSDGFIITGQSLAPFEDRVSTFTAIAVLSWVGMMAWTTFVLLLPSMVRSRSTRTKT